MTAALSSNPLGTELLERAQSHARIALASGEGSPSLGKTETINPLCMHLHPKGARRIPPWGVTPRDVAEERPQHGPASSLVR
jgi:hypothetical protein